MAEKLFPGSNDEDYAEVLTYNVPVTIQKNARNASSSVPGGSTKQGKLKQPVRPGQIVEFQEAGQGNTSEVKRLNVDTQSKVSFETQTSVYELLAGAPPHRVASLKYLRNGYLDFNDAMPDGFYDGGRKMCYEKAPNGRLVPRSSSPDREIILVNAQADELLQRKLETAQRIVSSASGPEQKVLALAQYVSNIMGGIQQGPLHGAGRDIVSLSEGEISEYRKKQNGNEFVYLGFISYGLCRHRSMLFKYFADRCGIRSRMIRGNTRGGHVWNIVDIGGKYYVVDVMNDPFTLKETDDPSVAHYQRENGRGVTGGLGAHSIPVNQNPNS